MGTTSDGSSLNTFGLLTAAPLIVGAALSAFAGYRGMQIATQANVRTTHACDPKVGGSIDKGLKVAFKSGAVMGLGVTGFGLFGISLMYLIYSAAGVGPADAWQYLSGFGFGASCIALFARVGGGVYTKAADVGADLVGKVEAGIPEDHPNNAAVIADNVGDKVGDVAGMGADLFESFVGSIIAACAIASTQFPEGQREVMLILPFWLAGVGILCSVVGTLCVSTDAEIAPGSEEDSKEEKLKKDNELLEALLKSINFAIFISVVLVFFLSGGLCFLLIKDVVLAVKTWSCIVVGLVAGNIIAQFTEYSTAYTQAPTRSITDKGETGPATVIIQGLGVGMIGTSIPTVTIVGAICACNALVGLYGIAIAAVGMLATLGVTLATDAYGPVADNAGGIAEMISDLYPDKDDENYLSPEVRDNTDALDAMGNTTAATGKGFAIGSAVLTAAGLIAAFMDAAGVPASGINIRDALVLSGVLIGASLPFIFAAITMLSVGRAAEAIILEVRRQFTETPELKTVLHGKIYKNMNGEICGKDDEGAKEFQPDYSKCIAISTDASIMEMLIPGLMAVFMPVIIGFLLTSKGLAGMLVGSLSSGFMLAVTMSNAGGAWDNAKKYVEKSGKKGTEHHDATVVGDTVGDPFKDTSGPALNILIKLMSVISLVI